MEITRVELEWCYSIKAFHATATFGHVTQRALSCVWENHTGFWERQQAFISQGADKRNLFINHRELFSWPLCLILWMISLGEIRVGGGGRAGAGQSLPLLVPRSPASRTFVPLCLPTPTLHCVAPAVRLTKRIRNLSLTFKLCQYLTFLFVSWPLFWRGDHRVPMKVITSRFS